MYTFAGFWPRRRWLMQVGLCAVLMGAPLLGAKEDAWKDLLTQSLKLADAGDYHQALRAAEAALVEARKFGARDLRVAQVLGQSGNVRGFLGHYEEAERDLRRSVALLEAYPEERLALCQMLNNLGSLFASAGGRFAQAETVRRRALEIATEELGPGHRLVGELSKNLADVKIQRGNWKEARQLLEQARHVLEKDVDAGRELAAVHNTLGVLASFENQPEQARAESERAVAMLRATCGPKHPELVGPLVNLGRAQLQLRRFVEADSVFREAEAIAKATLGPGHPVLADVLLSRAAALRGAGQRREAAKLQREGELAQSLRPGALSHPGEASFSGLLAEKGRKSRSQ